MRCAEYARVAGSPTPKRQPVIAVNGYDVRALLRGNENETRGMLPEEIAITFANG